MKSIKMTTDDSHFCQKLIEQIPTPILRDLKEDYLRKLVKGETLTYSKLFSTISIMYDTKLKLKQQHDK